MNADNNTTTQDSTTNNAAHTAQAARHCEVQAAREYTEKLGMLSAGEEPETLGTLYAVEEPETLGTLYEVDRSGDDIDDLVEKYL